MMRYLEESTDVKLERDLIEQSFEDFEKGLTVSEAIMVEQFGEYGWKWFFQMRKYSKWQY